MMYLIQVKVFRSEESENEIGVWGKIHQQAKEWVEANGVEVKELRVDVSPDQSKNLIVYFESKTMMYDNSPNSTDFQDILRYLGYYKYKD